MSILHILARILNVSYGFESTCGKLLCRLTKSCFKLVFRWFGSTFFFEEQPFRIIEYICPDNKVCVHSHNSKFPLKNSETNFDAKRSFLDKIMGTCKICSLWKFFKCYQTRIFHLVYTTNIQSMKYKSIELHMYNFNINILGNKYRFKVKKAHTTLMITFQIRMVGFMGHGSV